MAQLVRTKKTEVQASSKPGRVNRLRAPANRERIYSTRLKDDGFEAPRDAAVYEVNLAT